MVRRLATYSVVFLSLLFATLSRQAHAAESQPADSILPDTTKCYLSITDLDELLRKWQQTAVGRLASKPAIKPFVDDLLRQFQENMSLVGRLGTNWSELRRLPIRGFDWAIIQPENDPKRVAVAFVGRVTDDEDTTQVLTQMLEIMQDPGVTITAETLADQAVQVVRWPKQGQYGRERSAYFFAHGSHIIASDQSAILAGMIRRLNNESGSLRQFNPYIEIKQRCALSNVAAPDLQWFVEPFGFAETLRASNGGRRKRGRDLLTILPRQGFSAIQGVGGVLRLNYLDFDNLSQAYIYAPAVDGLSPSESGDRFVKAAQMLSFPNDKNSAPLAWIPADVGSYITLRCELGEAFEHSKSLVDDLASQPVFEDVLRSIERDPNGPMVNLREAIIRHLGQRVVVLTEPSTEKTPDGEPKGGRMAGVAIELTDSRTVDKSLTKIMAEDPNVRRVEHEGTVLWVMTNAADDAGAADDPGGFDSFASDSFASDDDDFNEDAPKLFPNQVFFVAHDHLIVTTTEGLAKKLLRQVPPEQSLARSPGYTRVQQRLADLGAAKDCFRFFIRTSKLVESSYRQLRLSERFDVFDNFGLLMEKVWVDGAKMPPFEQVATDMGDSGVYVHSENDGWRIVGFLLKNETGE